MQAVILIGHGSLRKASGAAMIRLAALMRKESIASISTAGFLNFSRPTLLDAVARCVNKGASEIIIQPYFLIPGYYVNKALPKLIEEASAAYPELKFYCSEAFAYHPALVEMVVNRTQGVAHAWQNTALMLMAHGTPQPKANAPIYKIAKEIETRALFQSVKVSFMELNSPTIAQAVDMFVAEGLKRIVAAPYFLQLGGHVADDLPSEIAAAQLKHPDLELRLTDYLSYDPLLLEVIRSRVEVKIKTEDELRLASTPIRIL